MHPLQYNNNIYNTSSNAHARLQSTGRLDRACVCVCVCYIYK